MAYQMPNACHHHRAGAALVSLSDWWLLRTSDYLMIGPYVYPDLPFTNAGAAFHFLLCSLCGCFRQIQWRSPVSPATGNTGLALPMCGTCTMHSYPSYPSYHSYMALDVYVCRLPSGNSMPLPDGTSMLPSISSYIRWRWTNWWIRTIVPWSTVNYGKIRPCHQLREAHTEANRQTVMGIFL